MLTFVNIIIPVIPHTGISKIQLNPWHMHNFTWKPLGILASFSIPAKKVTNWLEQMAGIYGYPRIIRVDNGPENISKHFNEWARRHDIMIQFIQPGKPAQNAFIERFNRTYLEEVLNLYLFNSIREVQLITDEWLKHYNSNRPHEALNNKHQYK